MANAQSGSVIYVDTTGYVTTKTTQRICSIKWLPAGTTPSAVIQQGSTGGSGTILWKSASTTELLDRAEFSCPGGLNVTLTGAGSVLIIYTEAE